MAEDAAAFGTVAAPGRHGLLRVGVEGFARALARSGAEQALLVAQWATLGRPLIARRRGPCDAAGRIAAGLPLPPAQGKARLALSLEPADVEALEPPPRLEACAAFAPPAWGAAIGALLEAGAAAGVAPRCFGSLAWSALTGLAYLGPASDLDLIFVADATTDVQQLLAGLEEIAARAPMRIDGEIILAENGLAANWRELVDGAPQILVKSMQGAGLVARDAFLAARGAMSVVI